MALIDKASLLMVPSTYEAGKLYNVLPSGNRAPDSTDQNSGYDQTRADFDFDRGSNTAATRIGSDGLIKKYRENKFVQSNNFSTNWTLSAASVTGNQSDKDGGTNAWLLTDSATTAEHLIRQTPSFGGLVTISVYAKSNTNNWLWLRGVKSAANVRAWFNLENGTKGTTAGSLIDYKIESIGTEGWYRCSMTLQHDSAFEYYIGVTNADGVAGYAGDGTGSIYIQNAQLESGLVSTDYLDSGATTAKAGVLVDLPRINYDANGENGSLLLEPSRQQLIQYSEYFGASDWALDGGTQSVTNNYSISPEGVKNAARLQLDKTGTTYSRLYVDAGSVGEATISVYMKSNTSQTQNVGLRYDGTGVNCEVPTEWKRFDLTATSTSVSRFQILLFDSIAGNDETADISIYGAMLEQNATYPSSYIPNHGESGGVTRAADSCLGAGDSSLFNVNGGVLFGEFSAFYDDGTFRQMGISGSTGNEVNLSFDSTSNRIGGIVRSGGTYYVLSHVVSDTTINTKVALKYKVNDLALYVDGVEVDSLSSAAMPTSLNEFNFAIGTTNSNVFYGNVKQVAVFNEALSDSELATLTTL